MKNQKLIIIVTLIVGVSLIVSQVIKQSSYKTQLELKLSQEREVFEYDKKQKTKEETIKLLNKLDLDDCLDNVDSAYWSYVELNGTGKRDDDTGVSARTYVWNTAKADKATAEDNCYKRYSK